MNEAARAPLRRHFALLCMASAMLGLAAALLVPIPGATTGPFEWIRTQYYVNYFDFGFTRRGLVGTLLYPLFTPLHLAGADDQLAIAAFDLICLTAFAWLLGRSLSAVRSQPIADALRLAFIVAPVGFMQFGFDIGRFDHLAFLLLLGAGLLILDGRAALAGLAFAASILTHEAAFFFGIGPITTALLVARARPRTIIVALAPAILAMVAIVLWGAMSPQDVVLLQTRPGIGGRAWARDLLEPAIGFQPYELLLLALFALAPPILLGWVGRANGLGMAGLLLPVAPGFALFALGTDYFRWAGLIFVSTALSAIIRLQRIELKPPAPALRARALFLLCLLPIGPLGVEHAVPVLRGLAHLLYTALRQPL